MELMALIALLEGIVIILQVINHYCRKKTLMLEEKKNRIDREVGYLISLVEKEGELIFRNAEINRDVKLRLRELGYSVLTSMPFELEGDIVGEAKTVIKKKDDGLLEALQVKKLEKTDNEDNSDFP